MSHEEAFRDGITAAMAGKRILARIQFEQVVEINPDHAHGWLWLAWTADSPHQALEYLQNARAIAADDDLIRGCLEATLSMRDFAIAWASRQINETTHESVSRREMCSETCEPETCDTHSDENVCESHNDSFSAAAVDPFEFPPGADSDETVVDLEDELSEFNPDANDEFDAQIDAAADIELHSDSEAETETVAGPFDTECNEPTAETDFDRHDGRQADAESDIVELDEFDEHDRIEGRDESESFTADEDQSAYLEAEFADDAVCENAGGSGDEWNDDFERTGYEIPESLQSESDESSLDDLKYSDVQVGEEPALDLPEPTPFARLHVDQSEPEIEPIEEEDLAELPETDLVDEVQTLAEEIHDSVGATDETDQEPPKWQAPHTENADQHGYGVAREQQSEPNVEQVQNANLHGAASLPDPQLRVVLAVDDSPTVRKLVTMTLEGGGYEVRTAENGIEAMKMLVNFTPGLILLDVNMPRMDGYKLCKLIKAHDKTKHIPVVMLSGKDGVFDKLRGKLVGCNDYISKPFESAELLRQVKSYVGEPAVARS